MKLFNWIFLRYLNSGASDARIQFSLKKKGASRIFFPSDPLQDSHWIRVGYLWEKIHFKCIFTLGSENCISGNSSIPRRDKSRAQYCVSIHSLPWNWNFCRVEAKRRLKLPGSIELTPPPVKWRVLIFNILPQSVSSHLPHLPSEINHRGNAWSPPLPPCHYTPCLICFLSLFHVFTSEHHQNVYKNSPPKFPTPAGRACDKMRPWNPLHPPGSRALWLFCLFIYNVIFQSPIVYSVFTKKYLY